MGMMSDDGIPLLIGHLFGEEAEPAMSTANERLMAWAEAYEGWLERRRKLKTKNA